MNQITIKNVLPTHKEFIHLCNELDLYLDNAIGGAKNREKFLKFNITSTLDYIIVAYHEDLPVGCAALRKYSDSNIELKRVFVIPSYRKQNIGGMMLEHLIIWARNVSFQKIILETGEFLAESIKLYKRYGFWEIEKYGEYVNMSESLCLGLDLSTNSITYCLGKR